MRVLDARIPKAGVQLVRDDRRAIAIGERGDLPDLVFRVDHPGRIVGIGEQERLHSRFEGRLQLVQVQAGSVCVVQIVHLDGDDLAADEFDQFAVGEIVGPHDGDLVAGGDGGRDRQEQSALRSGGNDQFIRAETGAPVKRPRCSATCARRSARPRYSV